MHILSETKPTEVNTSKFWTLDQPRYMHTLHKHVLSETRLEEVFSNIRKTLRLCVCTCRIKHIPQIIRKHNLFLQEMINGKVIMAKGLDLILPQMRWTLELIVYWNRVPLYNNKLQYRQLNERGRASVGLEEKIIKILCTDSWCTMPGMNHRRCLT